MTEKLTTAPSSNLPEAPAQTSVATSGRPRYPDPFRGLRNQIDQLFDDFGFAWPHRGFLEQAFDRPTRAWIGDNWGASNVSETDTAYRISTELPGCEEKDLDVSISNGSISIRGEKKQEHKEAKEQYHSIGRRFGAFHQTFRLPEGVDGEKVSATFKNGVLELTLPKTEAAKKSTRKIAISKT